MHVLGGLTVWELSRRVWQEIQEDEILDRAASLSYYFLFALFPTLLFLATLLGLLPGPDLMKTLMDYVAGVLPGDAAPPGHRTLDEGVRGAPGGLLSPGLPAALWGGRNGPAPVITPLNLSYG